MITLKINKIKMLRKKRKYSFNYKILTNQTQKL